MKNVNVYLNSAPKGLEIEFNTLFTSDAIEFLVDLIEKFDRKVEELYNQRLRRKFELKNLPRIPKFAKPSFNDNDWKVAPVNPRLANRRLDLGDVSPSDLNHFSNSLRADVQGIQVDFDDGHCPTWRNQINGLYNVYRAIHDRLPNVPSISEAPVLMLRPRAWNMMEHNLSVNGREVPGPLFDFAFLVFHNGHVLSRHNVGPCFYLSKIESASEAKLWDEIFTWTESTLRLPKHAIKACVLIENILAAFETENILFELRNHSLGLNCGIWDYAASIISKFNCDESFVLPDRNKYVNTEQHFLKRYLQLVVQICHKRGAHATGGMAADLLPENRSSVEYEQVVKKVSQSKLTEIQTGVDGFMVYDVGLVGHMNALWKEYGGRFFNQILYPGPPVKIAESDLLLLPKGGVTLKGLIHNIAVAILFNYYWLNGKGHFFHKGSVEDSATAEISRAQVWQWIRFAARLEDNDQVITRKLVQEYAGDILAQLVKEKMEKIIMFTAYNLFLELINHREFPDFVTTYLNNEHVFRKIHSNL